jgi:hypothetical protein
VTTEDRRPNRLPACDDVPITLHSAERIASTSLIIARSAGAFYRSRASLMLAYFLQTWDGATAPDLHLREQIPVFGEGLFHPSKQPK